MPTSVAAQEARSRNVELLKTNSDEDHGAIEMVISTENEIGSPFHVKVDPLQGNKATEIRLLSFQRPHMRAFHFAWWSYHVAFLMWFSISPLLLEVQESLKITTDEIWTSSIAAVSGTIIMRFVLGPFCDKYGSRIPMGVILFVSAVPTAMIGLVNTATGLAVIRFFIGIGGSTFVMCQYWTTTMFSKEWCGTANAMVGGWGNLGGGVTQILVGSIIFPILKNVFGNADQAWRTACIFPALLGLLTSYCVVKYSEDSPNGNFSELKKAGAKKDVNMLQVFKKGGKNINTWLIFIQYACCFGVEITMNNAAAMYFSERFNLSTEKAAAIASIFGWMNLFARGLGGYISDKMHARYGNIRGRLMWQSFVLFFEGICVIIFAHAGSLALSIVVLIFFSIFVQTAEGSSYGIVPFIDPTVTGSISGIIGAGGNVGAVAFSLCFRQLSSKNAFILMGSIIMCSSLLSVFVGIDGNSPLVCSRRQKIKEENDLEGATVTSDEDH